MVVLLMYEHLAREWNALQALKRTLEKSGNTVYVLSIIYERGKALRLAKRKKVNVIVMPWFVDESHEKVIAPFLEISPDVRVINMHHEEIGSDASDSVFFPKTDYTKNGSYHFAWGSFFREKLLQRGVNPERIRITGNIRNDDAKKNSISRETLAVRYGLNKEKLWVLFAENRGYYIQRVSDGLRKELNHRGMTNESIDLRVSYEKESLDAFINEMKNWDERQRKDFEFIYRPHPGTYAPEDLPKWMHIIDELSIYEWISACDLFLTCGSTSIFEAEIFGKPCAVFESIDIPAKLKVYGLDEYPVIKHANEINFDLIQMLKRDIPDVPRYVKYLGTADGRAVERTAEAIAEIANDNLTEENRKRLANICKPTRIERVRYALYEMTTYIMVKTHLLYLFKFPRSAYGEAKDIPYSKDAEWIRK